MSLQSMPRWITNPVGAHWLLAMLVVEFFAAYLVFSPGSPHWVVLLHSVYQLILFMFLFGLMTHPILFGICGVLCLAEGAAQLAIDDVDVRSGSTWHVLGAVASLIVLIVAVRRFFRVPEVSSATLSLALSVYLLSGLFWALAYAALEGVLPGSFQKGSGSVNAGDLHYFSYVTMTTLGYGDVVPVEPIARSCALLQTLLAQVFIAVVIGRLVSMRVTNETRGLISRGDER